MGKVEHENDIIDLGVASVETRGGDPLGGPDVQILTRFLGAGIQTDD